MTWAWPDDVIVPGQNGDNPKRRQDKGNITEKTTEKCACENGDKGQVND